MIELVVFDLGRVLIRLCDDWRHACRCAGVELPMNIAATDDPATRAAMEEVVCRYDTGRIGVETFCREIAPFRGGLTPQDVRRAHDAFLRGPFPGIDQLLDDLAAAAVKTACLSNTSDGHWQQINDRSDPNFLPLERLTYRFASHLIGVMKPHDAIYEYVERETGLPPASLLFFDDIEANVAAARRRGWNTHRIGTDSDPIEQARVVLRGHGVLRSREPSAM